VGVEHRGTNHRTAKHHRLHRSASLTRKPRTGLCPYIWVLDLLTGNSNRLTSQGTNFWPLWSPDGKRILFSGGLGGTQILSIPADGSGAAETVLTGKGEVLPSSWSADGKLAYIETPQELDQILTRPMAREGAPQLFSDPKFESQDAEFSPDGRWMAYVSNETGRDQV
jgi:Tol biopolymer transport system component